MKKLLTFTLTMLVTIALWAVPAKRGVQTITQPDGTTLRIELHGDEFFHYTTTEDGYLIKQNAEGVYEYAEVTAEKTVKALGIKARSVEDRSAADAKQLLRAVKAKNAFTGNERQEAYKRYNVAKPMTKSAVTPMAKVPTTGTQRGIVLLVQFADVKFYEKTTQESMNEMLNGNSYDFEGATGSVKQYFYDQSNGKFNIEFDVVGPITVSQNSAYYGENRTASDYYGNSGTREDAYIGKLINEACSIADAQHGVNFSNYDSDSDGEVDFVYMIYAGYGENVGNNPSNYLWPKKWNIYSASFYINDETLMEGDNRTYDGKVVNEFACNAELNGSSSKYRCGIGTFCHEFSHVLGLPDYYDIDYGSNYENNLTPGEWTLMDQGNYNNDGKTPPNYSAYDKYYMGWATPTIMKEAENVTLPADGQTYRAVTSGTLSATSTSTIYYFENRQKSGWDAYLPGHGMLVWKVQYSSSVWSANGPNDDDLRYDLMEADGRSTGGDSGDPYPGTSNKTSYTPISGKGLTEITESNKVITFKFMGGVEETPDPDPEPDPDVPAGNGDYVKVTTAPSDWSGEYLIVYEAGSLIFDGSLADLDAEGNKQTVTITNNTISSSYAPYQFVIAPVTGGYSIKSASGSYIGNANNSNGLTSSTTALVNSISLNNDKTVNIISSGGAYLRCNVATSGKERFRYYKSGSYTNQKPIALYKRVGEAAPATTYTITFDGENCTSNGASSVTENGTYTATITASTGYQLPATLTISMGGGALATSKYTYQNGSLSIPNVTGDLVIAATATKINYTVSFSGTNCSATSSTSIAYNEPCTLAVTVTNGYLLEQSDISISPSTTFDYTDGKIIIPNVTSNITVTATPRKLHNVTKNGTNCTITGDDSVVNGATYEATITPNTGYVLTKDDIIVTNNVSFEYNATTGAISISNVTSDLTITATAKRKFTVTLTSGTHCTMNIVSEAIEGKECKITITPENGYDLTSAITVKMGGEVIDNYTYSNGVLTIPSVTGALEITPAVMKEPEPQKPFVVFGTPITTEPITVTGTETTLNLHISNLAKTVTVSATNAKVSTDTETSGIVKPDEAANGVVITLTEITSGAKLTITDGDGGVIKNVYTISIKEP